MFGWLSGPKGESDGQAPSNRTGGNSNQNLSTNCPPPPPYTQRLALPVFDRLEKRPVVLASTSPRRLELLQQIGIPRENIKVIGSNFEEDLDKDAMSPLDYVLETSRQKAMRVYKRLAEQDTFEPSVVISADTVVVANGGTIIEKPRSEGHQLEILKSLRDSDFPHKVFTAVTCIAPLEKPVEPGYVINTTADETSVYFDSEISDEFLIAYVQSGEAKDAAGGYKAQGMGALLIDRIDGDFSNVVGLPLKSALKNIEKTIFEEERLEQDPNYEG